MHFVEEDEDGGEVGEVTWGNISAPYAKDGVRIRVLTQKSENVHLGAELTISVQFAGN
jgi:hypothetical protein